MSSMPETCDRCGAEVAAEVMNGPETVRMFPCGHVLPVGVER